MILEGIVTTANEDGSLHLAAMGPIVEGDFRRLILRPFPNTTTFKNIQRDNCGVFHITDDACLLAYLAASQIKQHPKHKKASNVAGFLLYECCRAYEFTGVNIDSSGERARIVADVVEVHRFRDFLGFNRARHALLEAAIFATRFHILDLDDVQAEFDKLRIIIDKTGTPREDEAMQMLERKLAEVRSA